MLMTEGLCTSRGEAKLRMVEDVMSTCRISGVYIEESTKQKWINNAGLSYSEHQSEHTIQQADYQQQIKVQVNNFLFDLLCHGSDKADT